MVNLGFKQTGVCRSPRSLLVENARNGPCVRQRLYANRSPTSNMKARNYIKLRVASIHAGNANRVLHASVFCFFYSPLALPTTLETTCFKSISKYKILFWFSDKRFYIHILTYMRYIYSNICSNWKKIYIFVNYKFVIRNFL